MARARNVLFLKGFLFTILVVLYFYLFFLQVVVQYSEKYTNIAKIEERVDEIEVPTFTICTGWKKSFSVFTVLNYRELKSQLFGMNVMKIL